MNLLEEIKKLRNEMVQSNWPAQRLSDIITRYETQEPLMLTNEVKNDDRGPLDLTRLIEEKDREIADLKKKLCQCDA
tara:strand:- start:269 stop:499 length:231 start_codon:yes stop_codon:yes gene_type:complete